VGKKKGHFSTTRGRRNISSSRKNSNFSCVFKGRDEGVSLAGEQKQRLDKWKRKKEGGQVVLLKSVPKGKGRGTGFSHLVKKSRGRTGFFAQK